MYCKMCGNLLDDTDETCKVCGAPTGYKEKATEPVEIPEEVIFNPSFEEMEIQNKLDADSQENLDAGTEPLVEEDPQVIPIEKKLPEFHIQDFLEFSPKESESLELNRLERNSEFNWNIHEFSRDKRTEDPDFNWNTQKEKEANQKENEEPMLEGVEPPILEDREVPVLEDVELPALEVSDAPVLEAEFFKEIDEDVMKYQDYNMDKFFTFSKKNEEFQELLDKEYEKLKKHSAPMLWQENETETVEEEEGETIPLAATQENLPESEETPEADPEAEPELEQEVIPVTVPMEEPHIEPEPVQMEEPHIEPEPVLVVEPKVVENIPKTSHLDEMAQARALFFGDGIIKDNEEIKKKLDSVDAVEPEKEADAALVETTEDNRAEENKTEENSTEQNSTEEIKAQEMAELKEPEMEKSAGGIEEHVANPAAFFVPFENEPNVEDSTESKKGWILRGILIIVAVILLAEIAILGIRYFAPESTAAEYIDVAQTKAVGTVVEWMDQIKELVSGDDSNEPAEPEGTENEEKDPVTEDPEAVETNALAPNPTPIEDKSALVAAQQYNNTNIKLVKANDALTYDENKDYGSTDINKSKPIENNIWLTPEDGDTVYYDGAIVGTIIAFDSQWIDYVNGGSASALDLLKKDSKAYQNAASFSKVGKIKETFQLLEIGEIRQGADGFYIWVHEELQITENGVTVNKKYNWIYCLEPIEGQMKIVNYFKFK